MRNAVHGPSTTPRLERSLEDEAERIETLQLSRLAQAVLTKSPADLAALAESNPMLAQEWRDAFRRQRQQAEAQARFWSAAAAALTAPSATPVEQPALPRKTRHARNAIVADPPPQAFNAARAPMDRLHALLRS